MHVSTRYRSSTRGTPSDVLRMYLWWSLRTVYFTHIPGESYHRQLGSFRAANHYVFIVVYYARGHCTTLMIISLHSSSRKTFFFFSILCMHVGIKCTSNRLCVCPFRLCGVGCATANWHSRFKPADQLYCPVQFPLSCVTS